MNTLKIALVVTGLLVLTACGTTLGPIVPGTVRALTGAQIPAVDRTELLGRRDADLWLLVTFSSDDDYLDINRRRGMQLRVGESLCSNGAVVREVMNSPILAGPADARLLEGETGDRRGTKRFTYRTYFSVSVPTTSVAQRDLEPERNYDLRNDTHDLCIKVRGGNMAMMTAESGVATFPRAAVSATLNAKEATH